MAENYVISNDETKFSRRDIFQLTYLELSGGYWRFEINISISNRKQKIRNIEAEFYKLEK